jgi:hypothetical protein
MGGGTTGYCIEVNTRPAAEWDVARNECLKAGRRLPEPMELKFACGSISFNGYEWASNKMIAMHAPNGGGDGGAVIMMGTCSSASWTYYASTTFGAGTGPFRCVY